MNHHKTTNTTTTWEKCDKERLRPRHQPHHAQLYPEAMKILVLRQVFWLARFLQPSHPDQPGQWQSVAKTVFRMAERAYSCGDSSGISLAGSPDSLLSVLHLNAAKVRNCCWVETRNKIFNASSFHLPHHLVTQLFYCGGHFGGIESAPLNHNTLQLGIGIYLGNAL
jgi:hypothetical protein